MLADLCCCSCCTCAPCANSALPQVELDAVRPGGGAAGEELRLGAALLPLRLRLDQAVVDFLQVRQTPYRRFSMGLGLRVAAAALRMDQALATFAHVFLGSTCRALHAFSHRHLPRLWLWTCGIFRYFFKLASQSYVFQRCEVPISPLCVRCGVMLSARRANKGSPFACAQEFAMAPSADEGDGEMVDWTGFDAFEPAKEPTEPELEGA